LVAFGVVNYLLPQEGSSQYLVEKSKGKKQQHVTTTCKLEGGKQWLGVDVVCYRW
jgi:hypothetical protein